MPRHVPSLLILLLAGLVALAPSGRCPCWLLFEWNELHPHVGAEPGQAHPHGYLADLFPAGTAAVASPDPIPISALTALLAASSVWRPLRGEVPLMAGWTRIVDPPPPR